MNSKIKYYISRAYYKLLILVFVGFFKTAPGFIAGWGNILFRNFPGKFGYGARYGIYKKLVKKLGRDVLISPSCIIDSPKNIEIGDNVTINHWCFISGAGGLKIGNGVLIGHRVSILTSEHNYKDADCPIRNSGLTLKSAYIGDDVWIGANAVILAGCRVCQGTVVGAGAVVTKDVPVYSIVGGVPAKVVGHRCSIPKVIE